MMLMRRIAPIAKAAIRLYSFWRLDYLLAASLGGVIASPGLASGAHRVLRLILTAKVAQGVDHAAAAQDQGDAPTPRPRRAPLGLPPLPFRPPPPDCSTQPLGLPLQVVTQTAARAPLRLAASHRLTRGLVGFSALALLCTKVRSPFTGNTIWLPPRPLEWLYAVLMGPVSEFAYLYSDPARVAAVSSYDKAVCKQAEPQLHRLYTTLRSAGADEAARQGRSVAFSPAGGIVAVERPDINAACLPGGTVLVHSGILRALGGAAQPAIAFVVGHEVGHAIGRHSVQRAVSMYKYMFIADIVVGAAQHFLKAASPDAPDAQHAAKLRALDGILQTAIYAHQLQGSRHNEYEADELAMHLARRAGMNERAVLAGAEDTMRLFMKMEGGASASDNVMSTHPAAANRLQRLAQKWRGVAHV